MVDFVSVHFRTNCLKSKVSQRPWFQCIFTAKLAIDLESQGHIWFAMVDYVGVDVKINSILPMVR